MVSESRTRVGGNVQDWVPSYLPACIFCISLHMVMFQYIWLFSVKETYVNFPPTFNHSFVRVITSSFIHLGPQWFQIGYDFPYSHTLLGCCLTLIEFSITVFCTVVKILWIKIIIFKWFLIYWPSDSRVTICKPVPCCSDYATFGGSSGIIIVEGQILSAGWLPYASIIQE